MVIKYIVCAAFLLGTNITDIKAYKVKNCIVVIAVAVGLLINIVGHTVFDSIIGIFFSFVLFPLFALKMMGAGDIKAFCAVGSIMGYNFVIYNILLSFLAGGILGVIFLIIRKNAFERFRYFLDYLKNCIAFKKIFKYEGFQKQSGYFRFSFAISAGFVLTVLNNFYEFI